MLTVPMPLSEVLDRLTILEIKATRIPGSPQVRAWQQALRRAWDDAGLPPPASIPEHELLSDVNVALWDVEDRLRARERDGDFGAAFLRDARSVYRLNDRRAALKTAADQRLGSALTDIKDYRDSP